jgi:hypothetical protein
MRRLVIALTTLLTLIGALVVAGYLFVFGPPVDRAASLAPANTLACVTVYLSPSTSQQTSLADLLTRFPGLSDRSALGDKIDELVQQGLSSAGLDYRADVKPWVGDQLAVALVPGADAQGLAAAVPVVLIAVRDEAAAEAAVHRIAKADGSTLGTESYGGSRVDVLSGGSAVASRMTIVDGMLVATNDETTLRAVIDAAQGRTHRLSDAAAFRGAMRSLPADRLASVYLDISGSAASAGQLLGTGGYSAAGLAIVARSNGLQLVGSAPFDATAADASTRASHALASEPSSLPDWMPADTEAELVVFGAQQAFNGVAAELGSIPGGADAAQALTQLRALAALGLGIDLDRDILPLFDREAAVALTGLDASTPHGVLLLRPSDASAATGDLARMTDALRSRNADVRQQDQAGTTVTTVTIPQVGQLAYAISGGVVVAGLSGDDVAAALSAHASGKTLGASPGYRAAFEVAGGRGGNELYVEGSRAADIVLGILGRPADALPAEIRDILSHVGAVAMTIPAGQNEIRIYATVTVH